MKNNPFKIQEGSVRDSKVAKFIKNRQSGDYLDFDWHSKAEKLGNFFGGRKLFLLFYIFLFFVLILFSRAFFLQVVKGGSYRKIAEGNRIKVELIPASRGLIYDRFGEILAKNISYFFLYINVDFLPPGLANEEARQEIFAILAEKLSIDTAAVVERAQIDRNQGNRALIYENIPYELALELMVLSEKYPAIEVSYESRRSYPENLGLGHVLGYTGQVASQDMQDGQYNFHDRIGKTAIELSYESVLRGKNGFRQIEVDALMREKNILSKTEPINGQDIYLTLDKKSQAKLFEIMTNNSLLYNKPKMAAVVLDAKDGGVLAMVSLPSYDNNIFTTILNRQEYVRIIEDENWPLLNRVIGGAYPPGSVFKPIMGAAALEEKIINKNFRLTSNGGILIGNNFFPDWRSGGHGSTDIYWAIADSVNTFFYSIGGGNNQWLDTGLGVDRIIDYARFFGLGDKTGIDLSGEVSGFLPSRDWKNDFIGERWYLGDTYNLSIGQGYLSVTPIQTAAYMSYFANYGTAYVPHLIKEIKQEGEKQAYQPEVFLTDLVSTDNLNTIREALRLTITRGTARSLQSVPVAVAGKTGTAQFRRDRTPHSWFSSFAPYQDPKIAMTVLVEEGGDRDLAVTISRQFMEWYFSQ
ncbi:MAG: penicillin-binding protein 2 [Patescibacteria group bacterium]|nr:penicillin-binding protein 2 [Patescibacteria group bacterium]